MGSSQENAFFMRYENMKRNFLGVKSSSFGDPTLQDNNGNPSRLYLLSTFSLYDDGMFSNHNIRKELGRSRQKLCKEIKSNHNNNMP